MIFCVTSESVARTIFSDSAYSYCARDLKLRSCRELGKLRTHNNCGCVDVTYSIAAKAEKGTAIFKVFNKLKLLFFFYRFCMHSVAVIANKISCTLEPSFSDFP